MYSSTVQPGGTYTTSTSTYTTAPQYAPAQSTYVASSPYTTSYVVSKPDPMITSTITRYIWRQQNWTNYQMKTYKIDPAFIESYGPGIYAYFDKDRNGSLDMAECIPMITQLFNCVKQPQPNIQDVYYTLDQFDANRDGRISYTEFRRLLYFLAGVKNYS